MLDPGGRLWSLGCQLPTPSVVPAAQATLFPPVPYASLPRLPEDTVSYPSSFQSSPFLYQSEIATLTCSSAILCSRRLPGTQSDNRKKRMRPQTPENMFYPPAVAPTFDQTQNSRVKSAALRIPQASVPSVFSSSIDDAKPATNRILILLMLCDLLKAIYFHKQRGP